MRTVSDKPKSCRGLECGLSRILSCVREKMASRNSRTQLAMRGIGLWRRSIYHASDSTIFGTVTPRPCLPATFIRRK